MAGSICISVDGKGPQPRLSWAYREERGGNGLGRARCGGYGRAGHVYHGRNLIKRADSAHFLLAFLFSVLITLSFMPAFLSLLLNGVKRMPES